MNDTKKAAPVSSYVVPTDLLIHNAKAAAELATPAGGLARLTAVIARGKKHPRDEGLTIVGKRELDALEGAFDALIDPAHEVEEFFRGIEEGKIGKAYVDGDVPPPPQPDANPAAEIHAMLTRTPEENKARGRERIKARRRPRPRFMPTGETFGENRTPDVRDARFRLTWQWFINRALIVRDIPADYPVRNRPTAGMPGSNRIPVEPVKRQTVLSNLELTEVGGSALIDSKWIARLYNCSSILVEECDIVSPRKPGKRFDPLIGEHFDYGETNGDFDYLGNYTEGLGGHGAYFAYRPWPFHQYYPSNLFFTESMQYRVANSLFIDMDQAPGRGAFSAQAFNPGDFEHPGDFLIEDSQFFLSWDFVRSQNAWDPVEVTPDFVPGAAGGRNMNCNGAFVCHHYDIDKHRARSTRHSHPTRNAILRRVEIDVSFSQMPVAAIRGTKKILIEDSAFRADERHRSPHIWLDDDAQIREICGAEEIVIRNTVSEGMTTRVVFGPNDFLDLPMHLPGKCLIWKRSWGREFQIRDLDDAKIFGVDSREKVAAA